MSALQAIETAKFIRKTTLRDTESNTNFRMLDNDIGEALTSAEADMVTPLMSKVYTRLMLTPFEMRESERVLRFAGQERDGKWMTAWEQLRRHLRVSSETANKALRWMHQKGIIGYYAGKNGVGIRIFLNRAANSVATKKVPKTQKNLSLIPASNCQPRTSLNEAPFNDSFAVIENLETDLIPLAPEDGADKVAADKQPFKHSPSSTLSSSSAPCLNREPPARTAPFAGVPFDEIVSRLKFELEPTLQRVARQAAASEHERTREWLESRGLPKVARVAQREAFNVLRKHGIINETPRAPHAFVCGGSESPSEPHTLSGNEVEELAGSCVAMQEVKGQSVEITLAGMSIAAGGFLSAEDVIRVREKVGTLLGDCRRQAQTSEPLA
ncbi:MAG: hypothetical protein QOC99_3810 [Acidobacteriota bacterium]|jgi:hypothetical protein|nr:hypothetical protein [Acidobacteriota bacterium]